MDAFSLARRLLHALPPEGAHRLTLWALAAKLAPASAAADAPTLACRVWGLDFPNPIGLAAGFDKNAEVVDPMLRLGFGFVEAGSVTPRPQPGNPRPRLFRVPEQGAVINRLGFNNEGLGAFASRLRTRVARGGRTGIVGANLGKNRDSEDAAADYATGVRAVGSLADYLVVNVSSPNTPGLRALQRREALISLLRTVLAARAESGLAPPLLVKVAPDLTEEEIEDVAASVMEAGIDGIIVSNTTISRPAGLPPELAGEQGGLSGKPLFQLSTGVLAAFHRATKGRVPLIGVGGVSSGADAYAKIRAGASLVQLYTALIYDGPALVGRIKGELADLLRRDGFASVGEAIGADSHI
jgi:dihydroorotate dehydrogenase